MTAPPALRGRGQLSAHPRESLLGVSLGLGGGGRGGSSRESERPTEGKGTRSSRADFTQAFGTRVPEQRQTEIQWGLDTLSPSVRTLG